MLHTLRDYIASRNVLPIGVLIFLTGFFFFPGSNSHKIFFYIAVLAPLLLTLSRHDARRLIRSKLFVACLIFWVYSFLTIAWNPETVPSDIVKYAFRLLNVAAFFAAVMLLMNRQSDYEETVFKWLVWVAAGGAIYSVVSFYAEHPFPETRLKNCCHLYHAIIGASAFGLVVIVSYYKAVGSEQRSNRWLYTLILLILLCDMLLTQSRGPLLALVAALGTGEVLRKNMKWIAPLALLAVTYLLLVYFDVIEAGGFVTRNNLFSYRLEIWDLTCDKILAAPWLGHGINTDETVLLSVGEYVQHPHSAYLGTVLYGGILGGLLLLAIIGLSLQEGVKQYRIHGQRDTLHLSLLLFGLACMVTDGHQLLTNPRPLWLFFWFPIALLASKQISRDA